MNDFKVGDKVRLKDTITLAYLESLQKVIYPSYFNIEMEVDGLNTLRKMHKSYFEIEYIFHNRSFHLVGVEQRLRVRCEYFEHFDFLDVL